MSDSEPSRGLGEASPRAEDGLTSSKSSEVYDASSAQSTRSNLSSGLSGIGTPLIDERTGPKSEAPEQYIGLGCLCFLNIFTTDNEVYGDGFQWTNIDYVSLALDSELATALGEGTRKLMHAGWIRIMINGREFSTEEKTTILRVYVLSEDAGHRSVDRHSKGLRAALVKLIAELDVSPETWSGQYSPDQTGTFDLWPTAQDQSLFYLFNKLPSPSPAPDRIMDRYARRAATDLLDYTLPTVPGVSYDAAIEEGSFMEISDPFRDVIMPDGLKTKLYPYQARSAAVMIQREAAPQLVLDPTVEPRQAPDGQTYYYRARDSKIFRHPAFYESNRGGILAETMGLGKTVICLAVILATKYHLPKVPPHYQTGVPIRERVGSLMAMAASTATRHSVPWASYLQQCEERQCIELNSCRKELAKVTAKYDVPVLAPRNNRSAVLPPPQQFTLCHGTIIVVPRNLLHQWQSEINKHVIDGALRVLVVDASKVLPAANELATYDIVLFSRPRFEKEIKHGSDASGRRTLDGTVPLNCNCMYIGSTRTRDCRCFQRDQVYRSPLLELHWLRMIIDEGHSFSSSKSNAVYVAGLIRAERRWVVSGTPAKDLVGVEVDLSTNDGCTELDSGTLRAAALEQRKNFTYREDTAGAAKGLGALVTHFLQVRPWANSHVEGKTDWDEYIYRHEHHHLKTYTAFSTCLQRALQALVVKTRPEDVERDIRLPPLTHRAVYLEPCYYDKLSANMFIQVLRANAITSERADRDYLWHKDSQKARQSLIKNLRQSNFTWTGFSEDDVRTTIETSLKYLSKEDINCSEEDRTLLMQSTQLIPRLLESSAWLALSKSHEVGLFVESWPEESVDEWALCPGKPMMMGITQLIKAEEFVQSHGLEEDLLPAFKTAGGDAKAELYTTAQEDRAKKENGNSSASTTIIKAGVPLSCVEGEPVAGRRPPGVKKSNQKNKDGLLIGVDGPDPNLISPVKKKKRKLSTEFQKLPSDSPLSKAHILGTTSAKLSYIIDTVMKYQEDEKILIFYDGNNTAYYIAQALELLHVDHRIYALGIDNSIRSKHVVSFTEDPKLRVLLIDVACGALGLNLNVASRVIIVNPINRPNIEAQAIKRAHRIGQTRPVNVETLVLKDTVEEAIFKRAKAMTRNEHLEAKYLEDDDEVASIIQNAPIIPINQGEANGKSQMALIHNPQKIFGRPGRAKAGHKRSDKHPEGGQQKKKRVRSRVAKETQTEMQARIPPNSDLIVPVIPSIPTQVGGVASGPAVSIFGGPEIRLANESIFNEQL